jgi:hypothetical protein
MNPCGQTPTAMGTGPIARSGSAGTQFAETDSLCRPAGIGLAATAEPVPGRPDYPPQRPAPRALPTNHASAGTDPMVSAGWLALRNKPPVFSAPAEVCLIGGPGCDQTDDYCRVGLGVLLLAGGGQACWATPPGSTVGSTHNSPRPNMFGCGRNRIPQRASTTPGRARCGSTRRIATMSGRADGLRCQGGRRVRGILGRAGRCRKCSSARTARRLRRSAGFVAAWSAYVDDLAPSGAATAHRRVHGGVPRPRGCPARR